MMIKLCRYITSPKFLLDRLCQWLVGLFNWCDERQPVSQSVGQIDRRDDDEHGHWACTIYLESLQ